MFDKTISKLKFFWRLWKLRKHVGEDAVVREAVLSDEFLTAAKEIWNFRQSDLWKVTDEAVKTVYHQGELQKAAALEDKLSFCPRCGQIPLMDRRFEEVRELVLSQVSEQPTTSDLDFAIIFNFWFVKHGFKR